MRRPGHTLVELVATMALFLAFMSLVTSLLVGMLRAYRRGEEAVRPVQELRNAMGLVASSLRSASAYREPSSAEREAGADHLVLQVRGHDESYRTLCYSLVERKDAATGRQVRDLVEVEFLTQPDGTYANVVAGTPKVLLRNATRLVFMQVPEDVVMRVDLAVGMPGDTEASLRTLVFPRALEVRDEVAR